MNFDPFVHGYVFFIMLAWVFFAFAFVIIWRALLSININTAKDIGLYEYAIGLTAILLVHSTHLSLEAVNFGLLPAFFEPYLSIVFDGLISISAFIFVLFAIKLAMKGRK